MMDDPALSQDVQRELCQTLIAEYDTLLRKTVKITGIGDLTQRKLRNANLRIEEQQQELAQKNARLTQEIYARERLIEDLEAFAHTVAHDLKNPLNVIIGYMELVLEILVDRNDTELLTMVRQVIETSNRMSRIITELLTFASVRQQEVVPIPVNMGGVIQEVEKRLESMILEYQARLDKPSSWPIALGHARWLEEVWANYISNALKYGGNPPHLALGFDSLPLEAASEKSPVGAPQIRFWVRDNGPGLAPEALARVFTKFTRFNEVRASGHGLGLSIVKRIVEKLGGQVGVESIPGQGSTFFFTLPAPVVNESTAAPALPDFSQSLKALSPELIESLRKAILAADLGDIIEFVGQISAQNAVLGKALIAFAENFDYKSMLELLNQSDQQ